MQVSVQHELYTVVNLLQRRYNNLVTQSLSLSLLYHIYYVHNVMCVYFYCIQMAVLCLIHPYTQIKNMHDINSIFRVHILK